MQAVKRILRHIKGTINYGIRILTQNTSLYGFSDANWAGCPDTRRSTSGYYMFIGSICVSWNAKKQPTVSHSTAEA